MDFHCRVNFRCVNEIEEIYGRSRVNVKVDLAQLYVGAHPFIHYFYFICASKIYVRTHVKFTRQWKTNLITCGPELQF